MRGAYPGLIYVSFSGYGSSGPDAGRAGFDFTAFWARSGIWALVGDVSGPPAMPRGGQGDHTTAMNLLAATLVALRLKEQTGEGQTVEVTLQRTGVWTIGVDVAQAAVTKQQPDRFDYLHMPNPITNDYETRDGRWLMLMMPRGGHVLGAVLPADRAGRSGSPTRATPIPSAGGSTERL